MKPMFQPVEQLSAAPACRVITVASGKGGVGKTNVSVNLAAALAGKGRRVLLMDADLGLANVDVLLGIRPLYDLHHVISGERALEDIIVRGPLGIDIVPAASGIGRMAELTLAEQAALIRAFDHLNGLYDVLLIDAAAGLSDNVINFSKAAQEVVVVVCDEPASLTDAYAFIKVLSREHGVRRFRILANMVKDAEQGRRLYGRLAGVAGDYLEVALGYLGSVPHDERLKEAVRRQNPVLGLFPGSAASVAFHGLAERVDKLPMPAGPSGNLSFFFEMNFPAQTKRGIA